MRITSASLAASWMDSSHTRDSASLILQHYFNQLDSEKVRAGLLAPAAADNGKDTQ